MGNSEATKQSKNERTEYYLKEQYEFRFNTVKSRTEYRTDKHSSFSVVTKITLNTLRRELDRVGLNTSADNIRAILESDFSPRVNPVQDYFRSLPKAEDLSAMEQLVSTVTVSNPEHWGNYLAKWLVGVVANAMNDIGCQNHVCLVLTGEQGKFKTTWLDNLCPKELRNYLFTGKIDPQSKDVMTLIAECLFVNIDDQLKALNKRDENELKNLITTPAVKYRRPYDVYIEDYPHLASFMASVNGNDFLTDPTGSRRFLPFEVLSIDIEAAKQIDIDKVYSEATTLYFQGTRYWFNDAEIEELHRHSLSFHVQTIEYELLLQGFEKPAPDDNEKYFMTTGQIIGHIRSSNPITLSDKRMGEALRKAGFERVSSRANNPRQPVYSWVIKKIEPNQFY